jgi:hypothetical protein
MKINFVYPKNKLNKERRSRESEESTEQTIKKENGTV